MLLFGENSTEEFFLGKLIEWLCVHFLLQVSLDFTDSCVEIRDDCFGLIFVHACGFFSDDLGVVF